MQCPTQGFNLHQMSPNRSLRIWTGDPHLKWALSQSSCPWSWNHDLQPPHKDKRKLLGGWFHVNFGSLQMRLRDVSCKGVCGVTYRLTSNWIPAVVSHQAQDTSTDQNVKCCCKVHILLPT
jgi:hypothetical protein